MKLTFNPPFFPDQTVPKGALSRDVRSQACWYFYVLAQKQKELVGKSIDDQILYEDEQWMDTCYIQTARTVAAMYGLESPDEFAKAWDEVRAEARNCELPEPAPEYTRLAPRILMS